MCGVRPSKMFFPTLFVWCPHYSSPPINKESAGVPPPRCFIPTLIVPPLRKYVQCPPPLSICFFCVVFPPPNVLMCFYHTCFNSKYKLSLAHLVSVFVTDHVLTNFDGCLRVSRGSLEAVCRVSTGCLESFCRVCKTNPRSEGGYQI